MERSWAKGAVGVNVRGHGGRGGDLAVVARAARVYADEAHRRAELGISKRESSEAQVIASMPSETFR